MISLTKNNLWIDISPNRDAFCGPYSFLINLYIFIRIGLYSIPLDFWESDFVEYNHWPASSFWFDRAGCGSAPYHFYFSLFCIQRRQSFLPQTFLSLNFTSTIHPQAFLSLNFTGTFHPQAFLSLNFTGTFHPQAFLSLSFTYAFLLRIFLKFSYWTWY